MANKPFKYQPPFPMSKDQTEYYLLTKEHVSVSEFEGKEILKVSKEGLTLLAQTAFRDVEFLLRSEHQEQVAKILSDPEASENDKFVLLHSCAMRRYPQREFSLSARTQARPLSWVKKRSTGMD